MAISALYVVERCFCSDLHIKAGASPRIRVDGLLRTLDDEPEFTAEETHALAKEIMPARIRDVFEEKHEADFAYSVPGLGRFRTNAFFQRSSVALAMRRVRTNAASFSELGLPDVVRRLSEHHRGLVLVTGPTGSGKTTTLAAMVDHINHVRSCHVITIEDPVEYLHKDDMAAIDQREVGFDTESFSSAMRTILRQDPDVILVGEMRDPETVHTALTAAETLMTANPDMTALYATGEPALIGAISAVSSQKMTQKVKVFGWDLTAQAVKGIDEGWIVAVVQQDPYQEGVAGVESILKLKKGETVPASIDIPVTIVTKQNVDKFRSMFK